MPERDDYEFPADLPGGPAGDALGWTTATILLAALLLALFNAQSFRSWAEDLPPGPNTPALVRVASGWETAMATAGLGEPQTRMRRGWNRAQQTRWPGQPGAIEQAQR